MKSRLEFNSAIYSQLNHHSCSSTNSEVSRWSQRMFKKVQHCCAHTGLPQNLDHDFPNFKLAKKKWNARHVQTKTNCYSLTTVLREIIGSIISKLILRYNSYPQPYPNNKWLVNVRILSWTPPTKICFLQCLISLILIQRVVQDRSVNGDPV